MKLYLLLLVSVFGFAQDNIPEHTLTDNLNEKLAHLGWTGKVSLGEQVGSSVAVQSGAGFLLRYFRSRPDKWKEDNILGRLMHPLPENSVSFREIASPSLHFVAWPQPDGKWLMVAHFDSCGPQSLDSQLCHIVKEVVLRHYNQDKIYNGLEKSFALQQDPETFLTPDERKAEYISQTFKTEPVLGAIAVSTLRHYAHHTLLEGEGHYELFAERLPRMLLDRAAGNSVGYLVEKALNQDGRFERSKGHGVPKRIGRALVNSFIASTPGGKQFAWGRLANVGAKTAMNAAWNQWQGHPAHIGQALGFNFAGVVEKSLWTEFGPRDWKELKHYFGR